jgi:hypothetical protein
MSANQRWYVVQTQPQSESRAELNLRRQGFTTYLPRYMRTRRHSRKVEMVARPLFPRYLFVGFDLAGGDCGRYCRGNSRTRGRGWLCQAASAREHQARKPRAHR